MIRPSRWLAGLLAVVAALVLTRVLSEGVYDIAFANLALDLSGLVSTVGLVYFVGYGVEVLASIVAGPLLDRRSPAVTLVGSYLLKIAAFALIGFGSAFLSAHLWAIVAAAAVVDLVHHVGNMALFVLLPRILDAQTLVRVQGIGATVRSVGELLSPVVAGVVLVLYPGARALLVAAGLQVLALALLGCLAIVVNRVRSLAPAGPTARPDAVERTAEPAALPAVEPAAEPAAEPAGQAADPVATSVESAAGVAGPLPSRRAVALVLARSRAWRRFVVLDTLTTLALSSVILSLIPLMREQLGLSPARAGSFLAFSTLGAILGGLIVTKAGERGIYSSLRWAPALAGAGTVITPIFGHTMWVLAAALVMFGLGFTVYLRSAALVVQLRAPLALLGTWYGLIDAVERIACAVAILATGFAFDRIGGTALYAGFAAILVLAAILWAGFDKEYRHGLDATPLHPKVSPGTAPLAAIGVTGQPHPAASTPPSAAAGSVDDRR